MDQSKGEVLEEEETEELAHSDVRPAAMHQQEALQVTELSKGIVAGHDGLHSFLTTDSDADVCSWIFREQRQDVFRDGKTGMLGSDNNLKSFTLLTFDHVHIVGSVSNGQSHCLFVLLYQTDHIGLLLWRDATADDRFTLACHVHEVDLWTPGLLLSLRQYQNRPVLRVTSMSPYLSHLLFPVVARLWVLRVGNRWSLSETTETQTATLLLLLVQNLILKKCKKK